MKVYNGLIDEIESKSGDVIATEVKYSKVVKVDELLGYLRDSVGKYMPISTVIRINLLIQRLEKEIEK